jgi:hypothetical protein
MKKIYLAIPYTGLEQASYDIANEVMIRLMNEDNLVFSPITHSHPISKDKRTVNSWDYWKKYDLPMIDWADEVVVIRIGDNGEELIKNSVGVQGEIEYAEQTGKPVNYYDCEW